MVIIEGNFTNAKHRFCVLITHFSSLQGEPGEAGNPGPPGEAGTGVSAGLLSI